MIKILIVLEQEDNIDFRAYALQISNTSKDAPPQARLQLTESSQQIGADNPVSRPSPQTDTEGCSLIHRIRKPLETRQIFMN